MGSGRAVALAIAARMREAPMRGVCTCMHVVCAHACAFVFAHALSGTTVAYVCVCVHVGMRVVCFSFFMHM